MSADWWRTAVVYQVYIRSFRDGSGDGVGDIAGLRERLPYLADLGVDAIWINPWYPSPQADGGYDVADYRAVAPEYGTLAEAEQLIAEAHGLGLKVILDIVPNHTSSEHRWFQAALAGDEAARARYLFRPGRGKDGEEPPNDWDSTFGGPAWTRTEQGDWYLHLFAPEQPDLDWTNPEVLEEFLETLRFWFDRDVDGFRIDVAHALTKQPGLPDAGDIDDPMLDIHPAWDNDSVHEIYREWRKVADAYEPPRIFVAESWVRNNERLALYLRDDELHTAFQFDFLLAPFVAERMRTVAQEAIETAVEIDAPSTWVLSNHDVVRHVTRYARSQPLERAEGPWERERWSDEEPDLELGRNRARAAAMLVLALPGTTYLYQGEELGLAEVEDIPSDRRRDPIWEQSGHRDVGRDGCRVPLPWSGDAPPYGFSPEGATAETWLPQPDDWGSFSADAEAVAPHSVLALYRDALSLRGEHWVTAGPVTWLDSPPGTLAFRRGGLECWLSTSGAPVPLPDRPVLLESRPGAVVGGGLQPDCAVWLG
ncbi:MAG TPA: glycoside hydrolase family 13 protein [Nocardioidaceae bacterium]|nr:glycoside hydrolase family 13 protein [Nocardioidaceae bacterium]